MFPRQRIFGRKIEHLPFSQRKAFWQSIADSESGTEKNKIRKSPLTFGINYRKGMKRNPALSDGDESPADKSKLADITSRQIKHSQQSKVGNKSELNDAENSMGSNVDSTRSVSQKPVESHEKKEEQLRSGSSASQYERSDNIEGSECMKKCAEFRKNPVDVLPCARKANSTSKEPSTRTDKTAKESHSKYNNHLTERKEGQNDQSSTEAFHEAEETRAKQFDSLTRKSEAKAKRREQAARKNLLDPEYFHSYKDRLKSNSTDLHSAETSPTRIDCDLPKILQNTPKGSPKEQKNSGLSKKKTHGEISTHLSGSPLKRPDVCKQYESIFLGKRDRFGKLKELFSGGNNEKDNVKASTKFSHNESENINGSKRKEKGKYKTSCNFKVLTETESSRKSGHLPSAVSSNISTQEEEIKPHDDSAYLSQDNGESDGHSLDSSSDNLANLSHSTGEEMKLNDMVKSGCKRTGNEITPRPKRDQAQPGCSLPLSCEPVPKQHNTRILNTVGNIRKLGNTATPNVESGFTSPMDSSKKTQQTGNLNLREMQHKSTVKSHVDNGSKCGKKTELAEPLLCDKSSLPNINTETTGNKEQSSISQINGNNSPSCDEDDVISKIESTEKSNMQSVPLSPESLQPQSLENSNRGRHPGETARCVVEVKVKDDPTLHASQMPDQNNIVNLPITVCKEVKLESVNLSTRDSVNNESGCENMKLNESCAGRAANVSQNVGKSPNRTKECVRPKTENSKRLDQEGILKPRKYRSTSYIFHPLEVKEELHQDFMIPNKRTDKSKVLINKVSSSTKASSDPICNHQTKNDKEDVNANVKYRNRSPLKKPRPQSYPAIPAPSTLQNGNANGRVDGTERHYHSYTTSSYIPEVKSSKVARSGRPVKHTESTQSVSSLSKIGGVPLTPTPPPPSFQPPPAPKLIGEELIMRTTSPAQRKRRRRLGRSVDSSCVSGDESVASSRSVTPSWLGYTSYDESDFSDAPSESSSVLDQGRYPTPRTGSPKPRRRRRRRQPPTYSDYEAYESEISQDERASDYEGNIKGISSDRLPNCKVMSSDSKESENEQTATRNISPSQKIRDRIKSKTMSGTKDLRPKPVIQSKVTERTFLMKNSPSASTEVTVAPSEVTRKASSMQLDLLRSKRYIEKELSTKLEHDMEKRDVLLGAVRRSMRQNEGKDKVKNANSELQQVISNDVEEDYDNKTMTYKVKIQLGEYTSDITARKMSDYRIIVSGSTKESPKLTKDIDIEFPEAVDMKHLEIVQVGKRLEIRVPYKYWKPRPTLIDAILASDGDSTTTFSRLSTLEEIFRTIGLPWPPAGTDAHYEYLTGRYMDEEAKSQLLNTS